MPLEGIVLRVDFVIKTSIHIPKVIIGFHNFAAFLKLKCDKDFFLLLYKDESIYNNFIR